LSDSFLFVSPGIEYMPKLLI